MFVAVFMCTWLASCNLHITAAGKLSDAVVVKWSQHSHSSSCYEFVLCKK